MNCSFIGGSGVNKFRMAQIGYRLPNHELNIQDFVCQDYAYLML